MYRDKEVNESFNLPYLQDMMTTDFSALEMSMAMVI
jgi:hypothetical protein